MTILKGLFTFILVFLISTPVLADGLADATTEITAIQTWLYRILFFFAIIYMIYQIALAMAEKQPWGDVLFAFGKVAVAGAAVVGATWAWSIWGS